MSINHTPGHQNSAGKIRPVINRVKLALIIMAVGALAFWIFDYLDGGGSNQIPADFRMPVADPPIEPDRPDLIGRVGIETLTTRSTSRGVASQ